MKKIEFLQELRKGLNGLPEADINERVSFYSDMIDDRIEEGIPEEEAVAQVGTPEEVLKEILSDVSLVKIIKQKVKPKRTLRGWEIALIIIGSPLWLALIIAAFAVTIALFAALWGVIIGLFGGDLAIGVGGLASFGAAIIQFVNGQAPSGIATIGAGLLLIGLSLFMLLACIGLAKLTVKLIKAIVLGIKRSLVGKEKK